MSGRTSTEESDSTFGPLVVNESEDDGDPVEAVRQDRTEVGFVVPSQNGVEHLPSSVGTRSSYFRVSVRKMPNVSGDLERSRTIAGLSDISSDGGCESLKSNGGGKEAGRKTEQERSARAQIYTSTTVKKPDSLVVFEESDSFAEETSSDEEEDTGRNDQEPMESKSGTGSVDSVANDTTCNQSNNDGDRD